MPSYKDTVYKNYNELHTNNAHQSLEQQQKAEQFRFKLEVLPLLTDKNIAILDIGCGIGTLLQVLLKHGYSNAFGIDISAEQVEIAKKSGVQNIIEADIFSYLKNTHSNYDVVIGMDIIEHFNRPHLLDLLQLIKTSLKPNGLIIFRTPNADAPLNGTLYNGDITHETFLNPSSAHQLMLSAGFKAVSIKPSSLKLMSLPKEILRKITFTMLKIAYKIVLFSTARSSRNVILSPNMIITAKK
jgi:2-polyprenyl-3-methyl-5-hydroxy-6-metoxy-1,4-benzoquinol methylase